MAKCGIAATSDGSGSDVSVGAVAYTIEVRSPIESNLIWSAAGVVIVLRDRTIGNSLREEVSQREKLASYGHIAAGIAHEVKNPLGGIRGAAELLQLRAKDDRTQRTTELIVREVDRITSLVDELMVFARGETLASGPLNLHQLLDQVLELVEAALLPNFQFHFSELTKLYVEAKDNVKFLTTSPRRLLFTCALLYLIYSSANTSPQPKAKKPNFEKSGQTCFRSPRIHF